MWSAGTIVILGAVACVAFSSGRTLMNAAQQGNLDGAGSESRVVHKAAPLDEGAVLALKVKRALNGDKLLAGKVAVGVRGKTVTLRGTVPSEQQRALAQRLVKRHVSIGHLSNQIGVTADSCA